MIFPFKVAEMDSDKQEDGQTDQADTTTNSEKQVSRIKTLILTCFFVCIIWLEKCDYI